MKSKINITWFENEMESKFKGYDFKYKHFDEGDFGSLNQFEFNSKNKGGNIDFWGLGWLGVFLWDYQKVY